MMVAFLLFLTLGVWKIYVFLPTKQLADDDKTQEAQDELERLMFKVIKERDGDLDAKELFFAMQEDESFDSKLFWRFNHNRLNQLLSAHYVKHPASSSIKDICQESNS
mgnify:CR=1 FL=1